MPERLCSCRHPVPVCLFPSCLPQLHSLSPQLQAGPQKILLLREVLVRELGRWLESLALWKISA